APRVVRASELLGEGEDLYARRADHNRVLELSGQALIASCDGPTVIPHVPFVGSQSEHRFDREHHVGGDDIVIERRGIVVRNDQTRVERATYPVTGEVANHSVAETLRI